MMLPGLLLRALIPLGFMPTFGPSLRVQLTLCEGYAPAPSCGNGVLPAQRLTRAALTAKLPDGGVERWQLTCMVFEQSLEPRHALGVGRDRGQVSVVEPRIDPGSIAAAHLILPLEPGQGL